MNQDIINIRKSIVREIKAEAKALLQNGIDVISLASGEPDFDTPKLIRDVAIENIQKGNTHYAPGKGLPKLRKEIQNKLAKDNQIFASADNILYHVRRRATVDLTCPRSAADRVRLGPRAKRRGNLPPH